MNFDKKKIIVFGAGVCCRDIIKQIFNNHDFDAIITAIVDTYSVEKSIYGIKIFRPEYLKEAEYDYIVIAVWQKEHFLEIETALKELGVDMSKVIKSFSYFKGNCYCASRVNYMEDAARMLNANGVSGNIAECGVYRGDFAKFINRAFNDRKLYLFDTFEGFVDVDVEKENQISNNSFMQGGFYKSMDQYEHTNIDIVMNKMDFPENVIIKKGWFPDSAVDVEDKFCFVSLDTDLYKPIYAGLEYFWPRMSDGGIIMIHDYFTPALPGVKKAIDDYEKSNGIHFYRTPVGDDFSIALLK